MQTDDDNGKSALEVHLAEYAALTTRLTYWVTLQYATYAMAAAAIGFIASAWGKMDAHLLAWLSLLSLLLIVWALVQTNCEIYTYVAYIETNLRQMVGAVGVAKPFWEFENFLDELSSKKIVRFERSIGLFPVFVVAGMVAVWAVFHTSVNGWRRDLLPDSLWSLLCGYVLVMLCLRQRTVMALQKATRDAITTRRQAALRSSNPKPVA